MKSRGRLLRKFKGSLRKAALLKGETPELADVSFGKTTTYFLNHHYNRHLCRNEPTQDIHSLDSTQLDLTQLKIKAKGSEEYNQATREGFFLLRLLTISFRLHARCP